MQQRVSGLRSVHIISQIKRCTRSVVSSPPIFTGKREVTIRTLIANSCQKLSSRSAMDVEEISSWPPIALCVWTALDSVCYIHTGKRHLLSPQQQETRSSYRSICLSSDLESVQLVDASGE